MEIATWTLRVYVACMFMMGIQFSCQQTFVALGEAKVSLFLALLRKIILLIPLIYILPCFSRTTCWPSFWPSRRPISWPPPLRA